MSEDIFGGQQMSDMLDRQVQCKEVYEELNRTRKELEELQDAIASNSTKVFFNGDPNSYYFEGIYQETDLDQDKIIYSAIQQSQQRNKIT